MRLNGWQRIGIVASVIWVPTTGMAGCCARAASGHAAAPPSATSNSRRPMVTVIRPSRVRCVNGTIPRHERGVFFTQEQPLRLLHATHQPYSGLMLDARMTLPHFSVSSAMCLPKSAGEPPNGVAPRSASRACILGSDRAALISLLRVSITSAGVLLGAQKPPQKLAS
jgi:hypothetical protein